MTTLPATQTVEVLPARLEELAEKARQRLANSRAENTISAYKSDMAHFSSWCEPYGLPALPTNSDTLVLYLFAFEDSLAPSTLARRLSAIQRIHDVNGHPSPITGTVREALSSVKREKGTAQRQAQAFSTEDIRAAIGGLDLDHPRGLRDRAVLLVGYAAALRRSELVALEVGDVKDTPEGLIVNIRRSKGDQEGAGQTVGVAYGEHAVTCPVRGLRAWLTAAGISEGPLFRPVTHSGRIGEEAIATKTVNRIAKTAARNAGLDPDLYSAHSLRSGHVTTAIRNGVRDLDVMATSRHKSLELVRHYYREAQLFGEHNSSAALGL